MGFASQKLNQRLVSDEQQNTLRGPHFVRADVSPWIRRDAVYGR